MKLIIASFPTHTGMSLRSFALYYAKNVGKGIASLLGSNSLNGRTNSSYSDIEMKL